MQKNNLKENALRGTASFPIAIYNNTFEPQFTILAPLHYHNEFEFLVSTQGSLLVQTEKELYQLSENQGLFLNANQLHSITAAGSGAHSFIAIVFDYRTICHHNDILFTKYIHPLINGQIKSTTRLSEQLCQMVHDMNTIFQNAKYGYELVIKQQLLSAFYLLITQATATNESTLTNTKSALVKEVLDYIENHYKSQITLQDMSTHAHISKEYLCRIFKQVSDVSPLTYLNQYRINKSMDLLLETDKNITEIAGLCGFNHCSYYNKLFLKYAGCTPLEYRRLNHR